jgi:catechol 1,2-dioxygenase/hydroxyquinol 1,2-dioxygenase
MQELDQHSITDVTLDQMSSTKDQRLKEIMEVVVRHLHEIAREVDLRPSELFAALQFLTEVGQKCTLQRQEFMILSAVLGLETAVNILDDLRTEERGTRTSIFGPFYIIDPPPREWGQLLCPNAKGKPIVLYGTVKDSSGRPLTNASVEIWQTDQEGLYDVQRHDELDTRGRFLTDANGRYCLRTISPLGYSIPMDGPVGTLVRAQRRHGMRPAHIHFRVTAAGYCDLITALYLRTDKYIQSDIAFGVTESLIRDIVDNDPRSPFPDLPSLNFDLTLRSAESTAPQATRS